MDDLEDSGDEDKSDRISSRSKKRSLDMREPDGDDISSFKRIRLIEEVPYELDPRTQQYRPSSHIWVEGTHENHYL